MDQTGFRRLRTRVAMMVARAVVIRCGVRCGAGRFEHR
jgi:hypothetical protein